MTRMITGFSGFCFIGDPHLASHRPGRRIDDYPSVILGKLKQAAEVCAKQNLVPVILGDLFHKNRENNLPLLSGVLDAARAFPMTPIILEGNHDKAETRLTEQDALFLLSRLGVFSLVDKSGRVADFDFNGQAVSLWAAPYGSPIPDALEDTGGVNVLITHHDLSFPGAYPGAALLKEIEHCSMLVNGHMHKYSEPRTLGQTKCHNPGNIARLSIDCAEHVPSVWVWTPELGQELKQVPLQYEYAVFDLTGVAVEQASFRELSKSLPSAKKVSHFAELLKAEGALEAGRSDDATFLAEELTKILEERGNPTALKALMVSLMKEVVADK